MADNKNEKLTDQQKLFVQELIKNNYNATQAAIAAGYSKNSARSKASQLLTNVNILEYKEELLKSLEGEKIASVKEVLEYYTRVMRREEKESVVFPSVEKFVTREEFERVLAELRQKPTEPAAPAKPKVEVMSF